MGDYWLHKERQAAADKAEQDGLIADSMEVRKALIAKFEGGQCTFEEMQKELKDIKRNAKKAGKKTRAQAYMGR